jgi:simple sugar transport system substrate-binding protein
MQGGIVKRLRWLLVVLPLVLAACSNEVDIGPPQAGGGSGPAAVKPSGKLTFAVVTHGAAGDSIWAVVKNGAQQADRDLGVKVTYQSSGDPQTQSQLIDAAVNQHVDGLAVSMANPSALKASVRHAVAAGIPVVTINSGENQSAAFGAITHIGQDEYVAGQAAGRKLKSEGLHKILCVIHEAGNVGLEQRCQGAANTFGGTVEHLQVDINDLQSAQSTIKAKLQADKSIQGVLTLNPSVAMAAVQARDDAGSKAKIATFDLSTPVVHAVQNGSVLFAVDQQPYLQGYLPISFLYLYNTNRNEVGGGKPVLTGPALITKQNAGQVAQLHGTR